MLRFSIIQVLFYLQVPSLVWSQQDCSGQGNQFTTPSTGSCINGWSGGNDYYYPSDFEGVLNEVNIYVCPTSGKRVIISNGIPDHDVRQGNPNSPCEIKWAVSVPLNPEMANSKSELPSRGIIAMAINGVPAYGPQEAGSTNAVEPDAGSQITDAQFWYGHAAQNNDWHIHNPHLGEQDPTSSKLLAYALDGYPIYGPLEDASGLDGCNGRTINGQYQYHVRELNQVDASLDYCNGSSPEVNWNYVLGCYSGSIDETVVTNSDNYQLPADCVEDSTLAPVPSTPAPIASTPAPIVSTPVPSTPAPIPSTPAPVPSTPAPVPSTPAPVPSTPAPVVSQPTNWQCSDSPLRFRTYSFVGAVVWRGCPWVNNKPYRCLDSNHATHCPATCDGCNTCQDSTIRFKLVKDGRLIARDCGWVGTKQTLIRCGYDNVAQTCPQTCGLC